MLEIIVLTFLLSLILNIVLKKLGLPTIIGYIATGTAITYIFGLHNSDIHSYELKHIAEFGIVFLMFTIGLEFSIQNLKEMKYEVFIIGNLQIILTSIFSYLIAVFILGVEQQVAIVLAIAISLSSTAIVLKTLNENGDIYKRHGQITLGILIMQDIAVIPILLLLGFLSSSDGSIVEVMLTTTVNALLLLGIMLLIGKHLLEPFFVQITKTNSDELFVSAILFLAIGSSFLAHEFGFSYSLGALIAGMLIAETKFKHQAEADLIPFRDLLLGIFFITVGMQIKFSVIAQNLEYILALLVTIMALKFLILYAIVRLKDGKRVSFKTALSLIQIGEFSLAILEIAKVNNLIWEPYGQIMIVTIVISMILTPLILKHLSTLTAFFIKESEVIEEKRKSHLKRENHVVVLGYGEFGTTIVDNLKSRGDRYCIVENNINRYSKGEDSGEPIIFGDALNRHILHKASILDASKIVVAIENARKLRAVCEILVDLLPQEKIVIRIHSEKNLVFVEDLGIKNIIIENRETVRALNGFL
jgi:CPA2 family monovalent cation:H+ antiporter-2